ncbi:hypothetical protein ERX37_01820 [Macrococcus hajekii]|uniref:Uncharacterized protein n=1 Tax=Macrococcus hajekii TaxID=198482 RepID=A0A4R6BM87_9STAP|nr:hypothetical protein [Macrococcus hajekii]TDM02851.1 hypothetical protein ERX37_01820 [Macrococcus hajekii]GGB04398.1 hypothetical protein GCM10007190_10560 [Macrococcus hajekii]
MRYFLIGLIILILLAVVLYFVLSRFYDYLSYRNDVEEEKRETRLYHYEENLELIKLKEQRERLKVAIQVRSQHFQPQQEIRQLTEELEEVNELIRTIESGNR